MTSTRYSPTVRRIRLGNALRLMREARGLTADEAAKIALMSRSKLTKLELGQLRPDVAELMEVMERLDVTGREFDKILRLARDAARKGWWDRYANVMGRRQRVFADLEFGAATVRDYDPNGIPAIFQTTDFIESLIKLDQASGPLPYRPDRMTEARLQRQQVLLGPGGPRYETVVNEGVFYQLDVPEPVMAAQLRHAATMMMDEPRITLRVLRYNTRVRGTLLPRSSFALYTFHDKQDPSIAVVNTITTDLLLTERREVSRYTRLYESLQEAALTSLESIGYLRDLADHLTEETGATRDQAVPPLA